MTMTNKIVGSNTNTVTKPLAAPIVDPRASGASTERIHDPYEGDSKDEERDFGKT